MHTLAVANYRSLRDLVMPLSQLNVITGANGSGKSNLYKALKLLGNVASGSATATISQEGGLHSVLWAGPETFARSVKRGEHPVQGGRRKHSVSLKLGFGSKEFSYAIDFGLPAPSASAFTQDAEIKRECIWHGDLFHPARLVVDRKGPLVRIRNKREWTTLTGHLAAYESMLTQIADPARTPEVLLMRDSIRSWRFYDHFRSDPDAAARQLHVGTRTPVLSHDGHDLAAALQTIKELGDRQQLDAAIDDAFPGASINITNTNGRFGVNFHQHGLLRPLTQAELSDGTLRYLLWVAALLTPRPPTLMVLNEPETSLHGDLMPALARLIIKASAQTQIWVVSHSARLVAALQRSNICASQVLEKELGETQIAEQDMLNTPAWNWPSR